MRAAVRDFLVCLTLAHLVFLPEWRLVLDTRGYSAALTPGHFWAVMLASLMLGIVFWCGWWVARRTGRVGIVASRWLFFVIACTTLARLCLLFLTRGFPSQQPSFAIGSIIAFTAIFIVVPGVDRSFAKLMLALSPCALFLWLFAAAQMYRGISPPQMVRGDLAKLSRDGPRVLVIVFDEMSYGLTFGDRPKGIEVPNLDRFRQESIEANQAYAPGDCTLVSLPALLTGKVVTDAKPVSSKELRVRYLGQHTPELLSDSQTTFSQAHRLGFGTAIVGWYHPYCFILHDLDYCSYRKAALDGIGIYDGGGVLQKIVYELSQAEPLLFQTAWSERLRFEANRTSHIRETAEVSRMSDEAVSAFRSGLLVLHSPVPHPPPYEENGTYFTNFAIADRQFAGIRRIMELNGTWEGAAVLVTSDHYWRSSTSWKSFVERFGTREERAHISADQDHRVPFIVKLPHAVPGIYSTPFNVSIVGKLVPDLLGGTIQTPEQLAEWLDQHRGDAPVNLEVSSSCKP